MRQNQLFNLIKKPAVILVLILVIFFLKELFLADIFPMFTGQDEARHYNTFQYLAEPKVKNWPITKSQTYEHNKDQLETYYFSDEIRGTVVAEGLNANREDSYTQMPFALNSYNGTNEAQINSRPWQPINRFYPVDHAGGTLYHQIGTYIEKAFAAYSILVRFYLARIYSVLLGVLSLLFFYLTIKNTGFSKKTSLILTSIISFEPRFSIYYSAVNYDALLILSFAIFTYAGILIFKNGANWKNSALLAAASVIGYYNKGTGIVLIAMAIFLAAFLIYKKYSSQIRNKKIILPFSIILLAVLIILIFHKYIPLETSGGIFGIISSFYKYLSKTITFGRLALSSRTYWGTLSWVDSWFLGNVINFIWAVEAVSIAGLFLYLFSKRKLPEYLPEKKYVWFMAAMVVALQVGIRLADWSTYDRLGTLALGTAGRYFIPNLASHITLVYIGLGMLVRKKENFDKSLVLGLILMFFFMSYIIFDVITYRYYL